MKLKIGILINPMAGLGGSLALKGSDDLKNKAQAQAMGGEPRAQRRLARALTVVSPVVDQIDFYTWGGEMGAQVLAEQGYSFQQLGKPAGAETTPQDTQQAATAMLSVGVDLIVFVGGDGTARDIVDAVGTACPVLGIPSGVKMHSGVFAISPEVGGELLLRLVEHGLVNLTRREVRDIDEEKLRAGQVQSRFYGELEVPEEGGFLQHVKSGGRESEELVVQDIAAQVVEQMQEQEANCLEGQPDTLFLIGPGSTTEGIMLELGLENTLLGVDAVAKGELVGSDLNEAQILALLSQYPRVFIVLSIIGGQGYILGRGNQQFSPTVLKTVGLDHLWIVASKGKITALEGRPLRVDTNDPDLDQSLQGYRRVITGYNDAVMYPVA